MIYLKTQDSTTNLTRERLLWCWGDVHTALFSPDVELLAMFEFKTHGKTYAERRENLRGLACRFSEACEGGLSWNEETQIITWFEKNSKQYGLTREFRENGII